MTPSTSHEREDMAEMRIRAVAAEQALAEAGELVADLHRQLDLANAAAVRMARRVAAMGYPQGGGAFPQVSGRGVQNLPELSTPSLVMAAKRSSVVA